MEYGRLKDARAREAGADELLRHLNEAAGFYHQALELMPPDAVNELAVAHNALGAIYGDAGDLRGFESYGESAAEDVQDTRRLIELIRQQS